MEDYKFVDTKPTSKKGGTVTIDTRGVTIDTRNVDKLFKEKELMSNSIDEINYYMKKLRKSQKDHRHRVNVKFREVDGDMGSLLKSLDAFHKEFKKFKRLVYVLCGAFCIIDIVFLVRFIM